MKQRSYSPIAGLFAIMPMDTYITVGVFKNYVERDEEKVL
jgi:hypothetical protein